MKNLLYIGNLLSKKGKTATTIDTLSLLFSSEGYTVFTASNKKNKVLRLLDMLFHILKYAKQTDYVLIDTYSTQNFYYAYVCSQLCRILNLKYVPILHGGNLPMRLKNNPRLSKSIFHNSYKNVSPSEYIKSEFEKVGYTNIMTIPNAIDVDKYPFKQRNHETIDLLWVRSFSKIYNPLLAIKLLKALKDEGLKVTLCMVGPEGDGSLNEAQNFAKKLQIEVKFTGKLSKEEWIKLSQDYNIFINTTNFDNMPVSVIEAMALGLPIISTNVGGMPFLIENGHDGILVNPNNADEFVEAIKNIISQSEQAKIRVLNAREKALQFDWNVINEKWLNLFS